VPGCCLVMLPGVLLLLSVITLQAAQVVQAGQWADVGPGGSQEGLWLCWAVLRANLALPQQQAIRQARL